MTFVAPRRLTSSTGPTRCDQSRSAHARCGGGTRQRDEALRSGHGDRPARLQTGSRTSHGAPGTKRRRQDDGGSALAGSCGPDGRHGARLFGADPCQHVARQRVGVMLQVLQRCRETPAARRSTSVCFRATTTCPCPRPRSWSGPASRASKSGPSASSPAASANGCCSRSPSAATRICWCSTSPPSEWTSSRAGRSGAKCERSRRRADRSC